MGRGPNIKINRNLEEVDSNPHGWLWGVQDLSEGSNCRCGGNRRELELEVEPEDGTELLYFHDRTLMDEELLLMDEAKWFLSPDEGAVKIVEMTKGLEY